MKIQLTVLMLFTISSVTAQIDNNQRAKLYFQEAQSSFNQNNFEQTIEYLNDVDEILGETNGRVLNLRIKSLYNLGQFIEAETALNLFTDNYINSVTEELKSETLNYLVRIERAAKEQKNVNQAEMAIEAKKDEQWQLLRRLGKLLNGVYDFQNKFRTVRIIWASGPSNVLEKFVVATKWNTTSKKKNSATKTSDNVEYFLPHEIQRFDWVQVEHGKPVKGVYYEGFFEPSFNLYFGKYDNGSLKWTLIGRAGIDMKSKFEQINSLVNEVSKIQKEIDADNQD